MIVIYGGPDCGWCTKAKQLAEDINLKYEYRDVSDDAIKQELKERYPECKTIPQIWWHDRHIGGYSEFALEVENTIGGYGGGKI